MNKSNKTLLFRSSIAAVLVASALGAHAAGLGKLTVYSAIGQSLSAEVALTATPDELGSLSARLAPASAFRDAGIDLMPALTGLRFTVVKPVKGGQPVLRMTTDSPLNEPFLHFLVELNWSAGRMVREYTFLLDPPEMLQVAKPASVVAPVMPQGQVKAAPIPSTKSVPVSESVRSGLAGQGEVQVKPGDTLGKIAREAGVEGVTLDQMLVALFNSNRDAFIGNNMNRLRAGKILRVPDSAEVTAVSAGEARKLVIAQSSDFNAYRRRLAEAASSAPAAEAVPQQQAAGKIKPQVESKAPAAPASDKLEVSRTEGAKSSAASGKALEEDLVARDKQLREAAERIAQLEKNIENLKKLAELKTQAGAQLQQQAEAAKAPVATSKQEGMPAPAKPPEVAASSQTAPAAATDGKAATEKPAEKPAQPAEKPVEAPKAADAPKPAEAPKPAVKTPTPPPPPAPEPDFIEENPEVVFGGGALLALLLGYFGFNAWRKKREAQQIQAENEAIMTGASSPTSTPAAPASAEGADVSILGDFSESASVIAEEAVDAVAEAEVLMAYGRDRQAEEILQEGLKSEPGRTAIHLKLLEIYAQRKDETQFEATARKLHGVTHGQGPDWEKATAIASFLGMAEGIFGEGDLSVTTVTAQAQHGQGTSVLEESLPTAESGSDLEFDLDLGTTSAAAAAVAVPEVSAPKVKVPVVAPAPASEALEPGEISIEFDFGGGDAAATADDVSSPVARGVAATVAVSASELAEAEPLEVDVVESSPVEEPVVAAASESLQMPEPPPVDDGGDFSIDLDIGEESAAVEIESAAAAPEVAVDVGDGLDFDFDLGSSDAAAVEVAEPVAERASAESPEVSPVALDLADISLDLEAEAPTEVVIDLPVMEDSIPAMDFDLDIGTNSMPAQSAAAPASGKEPATLAVDLPDIDLSLDAPAEAPAISLDLDADMAAVPDLDLAIDIGAPEVSAGDDPEVATKLELAQAYEEMGDREGARELLNEVLSEGSAAQRAAAQVRLDRLAG